MENVDESSILKPGTRIKPKLDADTAKIILQKTYGVKVLEICELNSYDDKNFLVFADKNIKNRHINFCADGYVLKILNSFDSKKIAFIEGQTELSLYLNNQKIICPRQLQDVNGNYYSFENENIIRLYEFIPGKILCDVPSCSNLFYQAGVFLGKMDSTLKNFNHDGYKNHKTLWMLSSVPHLDEFVNVVVDEEKRGMVEDIIDFFKQRVLNHIDEFPKQIIHGDFNEQNVLVNKIPTSGDYRVAGVIDYGDTQYSCLLFEIAIALTYMMLITGDIETGGYFLAGYKMVRLIPENEMNLLRICVCARLCQSLVLGLYSHKFDQSNQYLLTTQGAGWNLLRNLYTKTDKEVCQIWNEVADDYLTQSYK
ncbi:hypothetical protein ACKWTF_002573 [Chironomus riparius]